MNTPTCYGQTIPEGFTPCATCELVAACYDAFERSLDEIPHPMGCVCDTPDACVACTPEPDPDALDFTRLLNLGMSPTEAAELKDTEYMTFKQWQAAYA